MSTRKILYIGNKLQGKGRTITTIETLSAQLTLEGFTVYSYSEKRNKLLRFVDMLLAVLRKGRKVELVLIDTYSTQNFYYAVAVANLCRLLRVPYAPILHGGNLPERLDKNKALSYKLFNGAQINVAPSTYLMKAFKEKGYTNLVHIPNTISIGSYPFLIRKQVHPRLLWVRSFAQIYNPMLAVKLVEKLLVRHPNVELCMVGPEKDGALEHCKLYAEQHRLPISFTGKLSRDEWREISKDFDIFINTTNFDNTPVSLIEAMALGLPIVSTNVGGIPYLLTDQKEGVLVGPDDLDGMCEAVEALCFTPELAQRLSSNGRKKAETFDWKIVKQDWFNLLKE